MRVGFYIRAVPERGRMVGQALEQLGQVEVVWDTDHRGLAFNNIQSLTKALAKDWDWICLLQDDFVYCLDFINTVTQLVSLTSCDALVLFIMSKPQGKLIERFGEIEVYRARRNQLATIPVYKREVAEKVLEGIKKAYRTGDKRADDGVTMRAIIDSQYRVGILYPSLCEHLGVKSVMGNSWVTFGRERKAFRFIGTDRKPML